MSYPLLSSGGFRRLVGAQAVSSFGDWLATFALMALVLDISGSSAAVGGVLALRLAPAALAGPLLGWAGARYGRRQLLLGLDLLRAGVVALIPLVGQLWWVYPWVLVMEAASVVAVAARDASIQDLVPEERLESANGAVMAVSYGSIPLGAAAFTGVSWLAASSVWVGGPQLALWLDAATFGTSFLILSGIAELPRRPDLGPGGSVGHFRQALKVPLIRAALPPLLAAALGIGTLFSVGIMFVRDVLGADDTGFGLMVLVFGLGAAGGLGLVRRIGGRVTTVRVGVAAMGAVLVIMSFAPDMAATFLGAVGFGAAGASAIVSGLTLLQTELDPPSRLLGLGAFHIGVRIALSAGALAAGAAVDLLSVLTGPDPARTVMFVSGLLVTFSAAAVSSPEEKARPSGTR